MATYQATNACTWRNGSWIAGVTDYVRQGVYPEANNYENVGAMLFDLTSIRNTYANYYYFYIITLIVNFSKRLYLFLMK